jgi:hypothetical protein
MAVNTADSKPPRGILIPSSVAIAVLALLALSWGVAGWWCAHRTQKAHEPPATRTSPDPFVGLERREGPWGELRLLPLVILPPPELMPPDWDEPKPVRWFFAGYSRASLSEWIRSAGLSAVARAALGAASNWVENAEGVWVEPDVDGVLRMESSDRLKLYRVLCTSEANGPHASPCTVLRRDLDRVFKTVGIQPEFAERIRRAGFYYGDRFFLPDVLALHRSLTQSSERFQLVRFSFAASTYMAWLRVGPDADVERIVNYWAGFGRRKDLRVLLESVRAAPGGGFVDLVHILPALPRQWLYAYPRPDQMLDNVRRDCHWTSLNFFSTTPNNAFGDIEVARTHVADNYYQIGAGPQFGDLVFLVRNKAAAIHSCVYLAGNLVFTKNGFTAQQPWIIMDLNDVVSLYSILAPEGLEVQFWRNRIDEE